MSPYRWMIAGMWLLFVAYWGVAAVGMKRSATRRRWGREIGLRLVVILIIAALLQFRSVRQWLAETQHHFGHSAVLGWIGAALCLLGFSLAINARRHLGRNWGLPMSRKEQPELVTSGPYALIRHPTSGTGGHDATMSNNHNSTKYAILTPVRDEEEYIRFTLESVVGQAIRPAEWVIVDDGSTDRTGAILDEYAQKYPWIRVRHRPNRGFRRNGGGVMGSIL